MIKLGSQRVQPLNPSYAVQRVAGVPETGGGGASLRSYLGSYPRRSILARDPTKIHPAATLEHYENSLADLDVWPISVSTPGICIHSGYAHCARGFLTRAELSLDFIRIIWCLTKLLVWKTDPTTYKSRMRQGLIA